MANSILLVVKSEDVRLIRTSKAVYSISPYGWMEGRNNTDWIVQEHNGSFSKDVFQIVHDLKTAYQLIKAGSLN